MQDLLTTEEKKFEEEFGKLLFTLDKHFAPDANSRLERELPDWLRSHDKRIIQRVGEMVEKRQKHIQDLVDRFGYEEDKARLEELGMLLTSLQGHQENQ